MNPLLDLLKDHLIEKNFRTGDTFFLQGEDSNGLYFIIGGRIKIARVSLDGQGSILCVRGLGASRESVSRTLSTFESAGALSTRRGGVVILDPEKLKLISG